MKAEFLLAIFLFQLMYTALWIAAALPGFRIARIPIEQVQVFYGRALVQCRLFGETFAIGWIPTGASIKFDVPIFDGKAVYWRLFPATCGLLAMALPAFVILGPMEAAHHIHTGLSQIFQGAIHPLSTAQSMLAALRALYSESTVTAAGVFGAKAVASVCLSGVPLAVLIALFGAERDLKLLDWLAALVAVFSAFLTCAWILALGIYVWRG